ALSTGCRIALVTDQLRPRPSASRRGVTLGRPNAARISAEGAVCSVFMLIALPVMMPQITHQRIKEPVRLTQGCRFVPVLHENRAAPVDDAHELRGLHPAG